MKSVPFTIGLVGLALLISGATLSGSGKTGTQGSKRPGNDLLWEGIRAFYQDQFGESVELLSQAREKYPTHPTVHFTWAVATWLRAQSHEGIDESYAALEEALDEVIPVYDNLVHQFPEQPEYRLYLSASKGLRARVHLGRKEWLGVIIQGIKGYRGVAGVQRKHPQLWDTYLPIGLLNYYAAVTPPFVRFVAKLLGMEANKETGIEQIRIAAGKGEFSWIEASLTLAFIYLWVDDEYEASLPIAEKLRQQLPGSINGQQIYTETLIRLERLAEAEKNLELTFRMVRNVPPISQRRWIPTLKYQSALLKFYRQEYDSALVLATASIDEFDTELDTPLGFGYLLRGQIHDLEGRRDLAVADYRAAVALNNNTSAIRHARRYIETPFHLERSVTIDP